MRLTTEVCVCRKEESRLFLQLLKEFVFPRCCAGCGVEIEAGFLCRDCRQGLLQLKAFPTIDALDGGLFFFAYENRIKEAIHRIKFGREKEITVLLSEETEIILAEPEIHAAITKFLPMQECFALVQKISVQIKHHGGQLTGMLSALPKRIYGCGAGYRQTLAGCGSGVLISRRCCFPKEQRNLEEDGRRFYAVPGKRCRCSVCLRKNEDGTCRIVLR